MNNSMNNDVLMALLAMDSYNRGPRPGINDLLGVQTLGSVALISTPASFQTDWANAGFFAVAYRLEKGEGDQKTSQTFISYRGTDIDQVDTVIGVFDLPNVRDVWNGWSLGGGFSAASQGQLAIRFYQDVAERTLYDTDIAGKLPPILVGHSLGGGLAGFVGSLSDNRAYVFDHMPFGIAAWSQAIADSIMAASAQVGSDIPAIASILESSPALGTIIAGIFTFGDFVAAFNAQLGYRTPIFTQVQGTYVDGEVLGLVRDGTAQVVIGGVAGTLGDFIGVPGLGLLLDAAIIDLGLRTAEFESQMSQSTLSTYGAQLDPVMLHSAALLTILQYGDKQWASVKGAQNETVWQAAAPYILPAILDDKVGAALGRIEDETGSFDSGSQLATIIAYSAIDEGTRPFGDTGIRALFDDASDLGRALNSAAPDSLLTASDQVGRLIAEYAGLLASEKVLASGNAAAKDGILSYSVDARSGGETLQIDLRDATWTVGENGGLHIIETRDDVVGAFLNSGAIGISLVGRITDWYTRNVTSSTGSFVHDIDRIAIAISADTRLAVAPGTGVLLSVLNDGGSRLNASIGTDFVIGGSGSDTINGGDGQDILIGGDGNDTLNGGATADFIWGGAGADTIIGGNGNDTIYAGDADLRVDGGTGSDLIVITAEGGSDLFDFFHTTSVFGGSGHDKIVVEEGAIGTARINGGRGNDLIEIDATIADTVIDFAAGDGRDLITLGAGASAPIINLTGTTSSAVSYRFDVQGIPVDLGRALDGVAHEWRATGDLLISIAGGGAIVMTGVTARIAYKSVGDPNGPQFWPGERTNQVLGFALEVGVSIDGQLQRLRAERYNASDPFDNPLNFSLGAIGSQFYTAASDFEAAHGGAAQFSASFAAMSPESFLSVDSLSSSSEARSFGDAVADDFMLTDSFAGLILSPQENVEAQSGAVNANFIQFSQSSVMLADLLDLGVVPLAIPAAFAGAQPPVWDALESRGDFLMQHIAPADLVPGF
ncbi:calcium-binding protein [Sphingomonas sp.]|uniref:calcium-binding protein n=1 Tax=Sphingomonas sp. TaxID=28214 RepID=UPI0035A8B34B